MLTFPEQMTRWGRVAQRPLNKFEQMVVGRPFRYSVYWKTWNRVIKPFYEGNPYGFLEMNLSPALLVSTSTYENSVAEMKVRLSMTRFEKSDVFSETLPKPYYDALVNAVGQEQAEFMTTADLWPLIDATRFMQANRNTHGGGVPFHLFRNDLQDELQWATSIH